MSADNTRKYAVIRSLPEGGSPMIDATDLSYEEAFRIASSSGDRPEVLPVGRSQASFLDANKVHVWHVVPSKNNK